jgi:hypothetical protein
MPLRVLILSEYKHGVTKVAKITTPTFSFLSKGKSSSGLERNNQGIPVVLRHSENSMKFRLRDAENCDSADSFALKYGGV